MNCECKVGIHHLNPLARQKEPLWFLVYSQSILLALTLVIPVPARVGITRIESEDFSDLVDTNKAIEGDPAFAFCIPINTSDEESTSPTSVQHAGLIHGSIEGGKEHQGRIDYRVQFGLK